MTTHTPRLVCFDLDGTVMLRPNSLQYLLRLNGAPAEALLDIDRRELSGGVGWVAADHERAPFLAGLSLDAVEAGLDPELEVIGNLGLVLRTLAGHGVATVLITSGPVEVAQAFARRFPFDHCFGSLFASAAGAYTGSITTHLGSRGKVDCLLGACAAEGLTLPDCAAVGDGFSDIDLFQQVGMAIGLNCSAEAGRFVQHEIRGRDLSPLLPLVLGQGSTDPAEVT